jgi:hypothetical protein
MRSSGISFKREATWLLVCGLAPAVFIALALVVPAMARGCAAARP